LFGPRRYQKSKFETYECGVPLLQGARHRFQVKYYIVAILFVLFDIEVVFMIPWAVAFMDLESQGLGLLVLAEMFVFVLILAFGLFYAWWRGALRWD
jgi:NADH-quinone oxidoreductase subunit A